MTRPALLAAYERHISAARGLAPATVRNYIADLQPFVEYLANEGIDLGDEAEGLQGFVGRTAGRGANREYRLLVRDYVAWLLERRELTAGSRAGERGHEPTSVTRCLVALRTFMRYLISEGLLPDAPLWAPRSGLMRGFTPKAARRLPDTLSSTQAAHLLDTAGKPEAGDDHQVGALHLRDAAILELLYGCGLRVSEVTGLDVASLSGRTLRVVGKGAKTREVPLGNPALVAVHRYIDEGRQGLTRVPKEQALFLNAAGGRLSQRAVQRMVRRQAARADIAHHVHPHTLRHSYATHLLDGGADLRIVQELLGHSTPTATQVYTHISRGEARRVYLQAHPMARQSGGEST